MSLKLQKRSSLQYGALFFEKAWLTFLMLFSNHYLLTKVE